VFISLRNRVARALGSLLVASHNSQGYGGVLTPLHTGNLSRKLKLKLCYGPQTVAQFAFVSGTRDQIVITVRELRRVGSCGVPFLMRRRVCCWASPAQSFSGPSHTGSSTCKARFPYLYPEEQSYPVMPLGIASAQISQKTSVIFCCSIAA
jgi:hypothetical protein